MMVALGALDPDAEEQLADSAAHRFGSVERLVKSGWPFGLCTALHRQNVANELVVGAIRGELLAQPARDGNGPLRSHGKLVGPQQVGPAHRPVIDVFRAG